MGMRNKKAEATSRAAGRDKNPAPVTRRNGRRRKSSQEVWSFFSGAMGLDLGLEAAGLAPTLAVELDAKCCETIRLNRPGLTLLERDVQLLHAQDLRAVRACTGDVFLMVGGPPCQSFSSGGKRAALSDTRGNMIYEFVRLISEVQPKFFILENVANIVTAAIRHRPIALRPGKHWSLKKYSADGSPTNPFRLESDELSGTAIKQLLDDIRSELSYHLTFGVLDAADYGAPQHRLRFVMHGSRDGPPPPLPAPTHDPGLKPYATVRGAIADLERSPGQHSEYTDRVRSFFELIPEGASWRALPLSLQKKALGPAWKAGGGKTGFYRRLSWDAPSHTVTGRANRKASGMCHPHATRPVSVLECARLQGFPDAWTFCGAMNQQYLQIGNAVPVALGKAVGTAILAAETNHAAITALPAEQVLLEAAVHRLHSAARNKNSHRTAAVLEATAR